MKVPTQPELTHMQIQAILREHSIPEDQIKYLGEREYTIEYCSHPEYHGTIMPWYLIGNEHEVPVCDIGSIDECDDRDDEGVELENVRDDWYDYEHNHANVSQVCVVIQLRWLMHLYAFRV